MAVAEVAEVGIDEWLGVSLSSPLLGTTRPELRDVASRGLAEVEQFSPRATRPMIDFHCHLDLYFEPGRVAEDCAARGMYVLSVTTTPYAWSGTNAIGRNHSRIRTALGLHPQLIGKRKSEVDQFGTLVSAAHYVGEIGVDGSPEFAGFWRDQDCPRRRAMEGQINAAADRFFEGCRGGNGGGAPIERTCHARRNPQKARRAPCEWNHS